MEEASEPWEIAKDLSQNGYKILLTIQDAGGETRTSGITDRTGMSNQLVNYHLKSDGNLMDLGLVEYVEEEDLERKPGLNIPREGYLYRLTERGRETLSAAQEEYQLTALEEGEVRRRFDDLEDRTSRVEERLDQHAGDLTEHDELITGLGRAGGEVLDRVEELEAKVAELQSKLE